jgi:quinol monooxygenase YgiN
MIAVIGTFRLPPDRVGEAVALMQQVIRETLEEPGCQAYSYAEDVAEPGLFRVMELWLDRAALAAHFAAPHMIRWSQDRLALGFHDRRIAMHHIGQGEAV